MLLQDFIQANEQKKIKADINERWQSRITPRNLHLQGAAGAELYIRDYAKTAAAPKLLQFAQLATNLGYLDFALPFWKRAAELMNVTLEVSDAGNPLSGLPSPIARAIETVRTAPVQAENYPGFPSALQPGRLSTMQPCDSTYTREYFIDQPGYWGQPKIDGNKLVVFATPDLVYYQSRTLKLSSAPDLELDQALRVAAHELGNFILEGELTFLDKNGGEHRTGSQAATANAELGDPTYMPELKYAVFSCIWREGLMLRNYGHMVDEGRYIAQYIQGMRGDVVTAILTAKTAEAKANLAHDQNSQGREGEVWFRPNMPYVPGKHKDERFVRTKYLEEFEAIVTGFTATTAAGHAFGAMQITDIDGNDLGLVGTGFTREEKQALCNNFAVRGPFKVSIVSQGRTENGKAWHARYAGIVE